jgi:hypothetical protein
MNGHQVWRIDRRGGMSERIQDYSFWIVFLRDLCLQPKSGERNG